MLRGVRSSSPTPPPAYAQWALMFVWALLFRNGSQAEKTFLLHLQWWRHGQILLHSRESLSHLVGLSLSIALGRIREKVSTIIKSRLKTCTCLGVMPVVSTECFPISGDTSLQLSELMWLLSSWNANTFCGLNAENNNMFTAKTTTTAAFLTGGVCRFPSKNLISWF